MNLFPLFQGGVGKWLSRNAPDPIQGVMIRGKGKGRGREGVLIITPWMGSGAFLSATPTTTIPVACLGIRITTTPAAVDCSGAACFSLL